MKTKITLSLVLFLAALTVNATIIRTTKVTFNFEDKSQFILEFDKHKYLEPVNTLTLNHIYPGKHKVKVCKVTHQRPYPVLVYDGYIEIPSSSEVFIEFNHRNIPMVVRVINSNAIRYMHNSHYDQGTFHNGHYSIDRFSNREFNQLLITLDHMSFDADRFRFAKKAIKHKEVSAEQVLMIMQTMNFESNRLRFAKYAYRFTFDKHNYHRVNQALAFESSRRELHWFIFS